MADFVTVEGRALKQAMKTVSAVVGRRNTIPILAAARLKHDATGLHVTGTDLDVEITADLDVIEGAGDWTVCIDASTLAGIARVAGVMNVRIEPGENCIVTLDTVRYELPTFQVSDFPEIAPDCPRGDLIETFTNGMFAAMLDKVAWCVSTEETRYYLNGVHWEAGKQGRRLVATDSHRLAICRYSGEECEPASRIIPRKTVGIISAHLAGMDVKLFAVPGSGPLLDIVAPGVTIRTKLIDGSYPDVDRIIPQAASVKHVFSLKRDEIIAAIDQASIIGSKTQQGIRFSNEGGLMSLGRNTAEFGSVKVATSIAWPATAEPFGINGRYMREIISRCESSIEFGMTGIGSPFVVKDADPDMTRVVMPMRV